MGDTLIKENKLTDEQVVAKNAITDNQYIERLEYCQYPMNCCICKYKNDCFLDNKKTVDLIHRLQAKNKGLEDLCNKTYDDLTKEIERLAEENRKLGNEWDNTTQYCNRLQYENDNLKEKLRLYKDANEVIKRNAAELQKQVDELRAENGRLHKIIVEEMVSVKAVRAAKSCPTAMKMLAESVGCVQKDTAKEICDLILEYWEKNNL